MGIYILLLVIIAGYACYRVMRYKNFSFKNLKFKVIDEGREKLDRAKKSLTPRESARSLETDYSLSEKEREEEVNTLKALFELEETPKNDSES